MIYVLIALVIMLALGVLMCFRGKRYFFPVMAGALFLFGLYAGVKTLGGDLEGWIAGAVVGAALVALSRSIYKVLLFLAGGAFGYLVGAFICRFIGASAAQYAPYINAVFASLMGGCALKWSRQVIVISTAGIGAVLIAISGVFAACSITDLASFDRGGVMQSLTYFLNYLDGEFLFQNGAAVLISAMIFYFAGLIVQLGGGKKRR